MPAVREFIRKGM
jgi:hypothetical protein